MKEIAVRAPLCFFAALLGAFVPLTGYGFEVGYYTPGAVANAERQSLEARLAGQKLPSRVIANTARLVDLFCTVRRPDCSLSVSALDAIDFGNGPVRHAVKHRAHFRRSEIARFLKREEHRDLLVVTFTKQTMLQGKGQQLLTDLKPFLDELGYGRILVIGAEANNFCVFMDKRFEGNVPSLEETELEADWLTHPTLEYMVYADKSEMLQLRNGFRCKKFFERSELKEFLDKLPIKDLITIRLPKGLGKPEIPTDFQDFISSLGYKRVNLQESFNLFQVEPTVID
jgi:hypothetical protein